MSVIPPKLKHRTASAILVGMLVNPYVRLVAQDAIERRRPKKMQLGERPCTYFPGVLVDPVCEAI